MNKVLVWELNRDNCTCCWLCKYSRLVFHMNMQIHGKNKIIWGLPGSIVLLLFREKPNELNKYGVGFFACIMTEVTPTPTPPQKKKRRRKETTTKTIHLKWKMTWLDLTGYRARTNKQKKTTPVGNVCVLTMQMILITQNLHLTFINSKKND